MTTYTNRLPCRDQLKRDRLADPDLPDIGDRVGSGPHAMDVVEVQAS
ncbi:hypothetical protein [Mycolicibacterium gilvum]